MKYTNEKRLYTYLCVKKCNMYIHTIFSTYIYYTHIYALKMQYILCTYVFIYFQYIPLFPLSFLVRCTTVIVSCKRPLLRTSFAIIFVICILIPDTFFFVFYNTVHCILSIAVQLLL